MQRFSRKKTMVLLIVAILLTSSLMFMMPSRPVVSADGKTKHKKVKLAKHIVNGSGVTKEQFEAWLARANAVWNCSVIFEDGEPDTVNETDIGKKTTPGAIDVYGVSEARGVAGNYYGACWDQQRVEVCQDAKADTFAHELGHWFGLGHMQNDTGNIMCSGCKRAANATNTDAQQQTVRNATQQWLNKGIAQKSGMAKDTVDTVGDVPLENLDLYHIDSFFDVFVEIPVLRLSLSVVAYAPFDGELGFVIESDDDMTTGQPPEGIDYAVYLNPMHEELHFERYDTEAGWVPLDPSGITFDYTYMFLDSREPEPDPSTLATIIGISLTVPVEKLTRGAEGCARTFSLRAVAADVTGFMDWAPEYPGFLSITMYFKHSYTDYAPSGVPDFDQRQSNWTNPQTGAWSWCGPIAVSNSLWWMDSRFEPNPVPPPTINDGYQLLTAYGPWDDHDPRNLDPFARDLAWLMDTDGVQTGIVHSGTIVWDMQQGIDQYLRQQGLYGILYENTLVMPTFDEVAQEVERCEDVILLLGFWQENPFDPADWHRIGGHYVTVAGVDSTNGLIALSDPTLNNAEPPPEGTGGPGRVLPGPHGPPYPHSTDLHNDTLYVSHDTYTVTTSSPSPGNPEFGLPDYNITYESFLGQNFDPAELGVYVPGFPIYTEVEYAVTISPYDWYFKGWPEGYMDYAPNGIPDFDQRQWGSYNWTNPYPPIDQWSHCGPVAIANSLWWLDSQFEPNPVPPPEINDNFPLVQSYDPSWDDHDPKNVMPLVEELAYLMDTDGIQTGDQHCGTSVWAMQAGIEEYFRLHGVDWKFYEHTEPRPDYNLIVEELKKCQDVTLLLGFWQQNPEPPFDWYRIGGHFVTVAGVEPSRMKIAISDPITDAAEWGWFGHVAPPPNPHPHSATPPHRLHNNASYVSHDVYTVGPSYSPGGDWGLEDYWVIDELGHVFGSCQNFPEEWLDWEGTYIPGLPISTEIEYAVIVSCKTGIVAAGCEDTCVYVWDFFGTLQWQWPIGLPVVSVAMDNQAHYIAAGTRASMAPVIGDLWLFDDAGTVLWTKPRINVSTSYDGGWAGTESKSVDVKYNAYNQYVVVAAATDQGLYLYDEWGNLIFQFIDTLDPDPIMTIVRISQDGNYIIACDYNDGRIYYFSHLKDGVPGWSATDGWPVWTYAADAGYYWVAISGLGDYVAASRFWGGPTSIVDLYNKTGGLVWSSSVKSRYVRVDMPCHGRSVVAANDDPSDSVGCDLYYWDDGGDGWDTGDSTPVWTYWPGKELGGAQIPTADFYTVAISENGDYVATGGAPANTYLLTKAGAVQQIIANTPGSATQSVDLTFTGKYGASGDNNGVVWFFNKDTGLLWSRNTDWNETIHSIAVSKIYPCMFPFPDHDIAVPDATPDKLSVTSGDAVTVNVTVTNEGDFTESFFDVSLEPLSNGMPQSGVSPSPATVASLASGASTTITFTWDTTGLPEDNYTLIAKASIVQDEIDVYDNTFVNGIVEVKTPPDIAVINLTICYGQTHVAQNITHRIYVNVTNEGPTNETFTLTVYWNTTNMIGTTSVSLLVGETKIVTFTWKANETRYLRYTLSAVATPVLGETDTADNTYIDGTVMIVFPGDVNGDKKVDGKDIAVMSKYFGARVGQPGYVPNGDINCDGKIDGKDIAIASKYFGYVEP